LSLEAKGPRLGSLSQFQPKKDKREWKPQQKEKEKNKTNNKKKL